MPVVAEPGESLDRLPRLGRVVGQQLVRDHLMERDVQPGVHRLAVGTRPLLVALERLLHLQVLRFEQERALVLVVRIQPFQVEALIGTVSRRHRPGLPVAGERLVEPAVGALAGPPPGYASGWPAPSARAT